MRILSAALANASMLFALILRFITYCSFKKCFHWKIITYKLPWAACLAVNDVLVTLSSLFSC